MVLTWRAFGVSTGNPGCSPRSLQLVISKFLYLPSCWDLWNLCSSLQAPSGCFLLSLPKLFAGGIHPRNWNNFFFGRYSGLIFCRSLLCSNLLPTALATQTLISFFFPSRKTSVLFLCSISLHRSYEWRIFLNGKARWMWVTCCASLLSRTLVLIAVQRLEYSNSITKHTFKCISYLQQRGRSDIGYSIMATKFFLICISLCTYVHDIIIMLYSSCLFFLKFFLMWTTFKVFIEFVTILLLFYVLVFWPGGMWGLSSLTKDWTLTPCIGRWSRNHWTTREVPLAVLTFLKTTQAWYSCLYYSK